LGLIEINTRGSSSQAFSPVFYSQIKEDLVENALRMALYQRHPGTNLLHHSDRGRQYASHSIRAILAANHIQVSMSNKADCYDNAVMASFFGTLKNEWVHHQKIKPAIRLAQIYSRTSKGFIIPSGFIPPWGTFPRENSKPSSFNPLNFVSKKKGSNSIDIIRYWRL